jgi:hypothetical protein
MNMSEIKNVEHDVEAKLHAILHELETKLQGIFGSHPKIAESVAAAESAAWWARSAAWSAQAAAVSANPTQSDGTEALAQITQPTGAEGALSSGAPNVAAQSAQTSSDST